jgi:hypothetical protein
MIPDIGWLLKSCISPFIFYHSKSYRVSPFSNIKRVYVHHITVTNRSDPFLKTDYINPVQMSYEIEDKNCQSTGNVQSEILVISSKERYALSLILEGKNNEPIKSER